MIIVMVGGFFRFYNLDWDLGHYFHPDERNIAVAVTRIHFLDQLNPKFFAYGGLTVYLYRALAELVSAISGKEKWLMEWGAINLIGRYTTALISTITLIIIYKLGNRVLGKKYALLATFWAAIVPGLVQIAHYDITENWLIFWGVLITLLALKLSKNISWKNYLWLGIALGLAVATKITALAFLSVVGVSQIKGRSWMKLGVMLVVAGMVFCVFSPYTFLDWAEFSKSMNYENGVVSGKYKVVYVLQFEKTIPYLFQLKNSLWQLGGIAILGGLGIIIMLIWAIKKKKWEYLIFLSFPLAYFGYVGMWYTKFIRYMSPLLPFMIIGAAWMLKIIRRRSLTGYRILLVVSVGITIFWGLAFLRIYQKPQTRVLASEWIYQNVAMGSKIITEHWDDGLPIPLGMNNPGQYESVSLTVWEPDNEQKAKYLATELEWADYIFINSRRNYGVISKLPQRYPITAKYYQRLFKGELGYQKVAEFSSYPTFLGIIINDDLSEETFQVIDHPKIYLYKNMGRFSQQELEELVR